jgi:betaine-aldehyde dehydrogenase
MREELFIDGRWVAPVERGSFDVINPSTEELVHRAPCAGAADVDRAVAAARRAFDGDSGSVSWARTSGRERARWLAAMAAAISARKDELARLEVIDNGKPLPEAAWDIDDAIGCFSYYAELAEELDGSQEEPLSLPDPRFRSWVRREPVGVAAQIIPWNYPLLMAAWKVAPALAAGATCVLKPSELTPLSALELGAVAQEVELPPGVLNIVTGTGPSTGEPLSRHPGVDKVAFTGSVPTGVRVMTAAAQDIKNVSLELGGKSPFIVFDDADVERAVEWVMFGIFWNQGQVCSATSRLLVARGIADRLCSRLAEEAPRIRIGDGLEPGTLLGPLVSRGQHDKVMAAIAAATREGATLLTGGHIPRERGYFVEPTVFVDPPLTSQLWREEIFGPVLAVRRFDDEDEAIRLANDTRFGLAAAVMSADGKRSMRVARSLRAGVVWIDCSQPTFSQAPWGGMKHSGVGRELGRWGLDSYLEVKQITAYTSDQPWGWYLE